MPDWYTCLGAYNDRGPTRNSNRNSRLLIGLGTFNRSLNCHNKADGVLGNYFRHGTRHFCCARPDTSTGSKHNTLFHPSLQPIYCTSNTWSTPVIERHKAHCAEHQTQRIDSMILQSTELILNSRQLMTRLPHQLSMRVDPKDTPHIILQYLAIHCEWYAEWVQCGD